MTIYFFIYNLGGGGGGGGGTGIAFTSFLLSKDASVNALIRHLLVNFICAAVSS